MAYKRNPMRAERMCGLARFLMNLPAMAADTAATQWFERTLDDSAPRRLYIPQAFLAADACLKLALNLASGLVGEPRGDPPGGGRATAVHGDREPDHGRAWPAAATGRRPTR